VAGARGWLGSREPKTQRPRVLPLPPLCRSFEAYNRAAAQGRTHADYAPAIPFGQAYAARPWLGHVVSALGLAPHTLGLFLTNMYLVAPPAAPAAS
jgi:hypothetical protein